MPRTITIFAIAFLMFCVSLGAQTKGTINGYTKDPTGAFVPGVNVTITDERTGLSRATTSDATGFYQVLGLVSGVYTIEAEITGFKTFRNTAVVLTVDENVRADVQLELGDVTESIEVVAAAAQIDTFSSEASSTITDERIVDLPLSGRNVFALAKTLPGVLNVSARDNSDISSARAGPQMNVNGGRANMNYNQFNGAYFMNPSRNTGLNVPPPDAIQEFKIQTSNFSADSGRNPGSNITIVSKQGTNEFHGALWHFLRNDNLNARSFFQGQKPELKKNQYGGAAGGPMVKDKVFIFGTFEINDDRRQPTTTDSEPPSTAELGGDFSHLSKQLVNPFDGTPFPNNQIPVSMFDSASKNILQFVPTVANPGDTFQGLGVRPRDSELYMVRGDLNLSDKQNLFVTYYLNQTKDLTEGVGAYGTDFNGWTGRARSTRVQTASLNHVYAASSTVLNQLTLGYTRSFSISEATVNRTPESLGIAGMPEYTDGGSPRFRVSGRWDLGSGGTVDFVSNTYQIKDDVSVIRGRHTLKVGFEYMDIGWFQGFLGPPRFTFSGVRTGGGVSAGAGDSTADFLLGAYDNLPVSAGVRNNDDATTYTVFYFHDDYKVTPRFTLNMGLRYELSTPWVEKFDRLNKVVFDETAQSTVVPNAPPGLLFPGDRDPSGEEIKRALTKNDRNNFAPRFGFAWDVFGDGRTAVRGAYGIFYETANGDTLAQTNPPFTVGRQTYRDGLLSDPFGSIGATPLPVSAPPSDFTFTFPLNGLWGPISNNLASTYVQNWSFFVERELSRDYTLSTGYIGKSGLNLLAFRPFNSAIFIPGTDAEGNALSTRGNQDDRVPFLPGVYGSGGAYLDNPFRSNYHSFQVELKKRFSEGLQFSTSYTLAKSLDSSSTTNLGGCLTDPFRPDHDYGRSSWDRRHAYVLSGIWSPPVYRSKQGAASRLLGGWSLSGITTIQSGGAFSIDSGQDTLLASGCRTRADIVGSPKRDHGSRDDMIGEFFNTEAFARPPDGGVGTSSRGVLSGPAFVNTDLAILKDIRVTEKTRFQFRAEFFNLLNQVNFNNPSNRLTRGNFGRITGAAAGRTIQLGLKFLW